MKKSLYMGILIALVAVFVYSRPVIDAKFFGASLVGGFAGYFSNDNELRNRIAELEKENEDLKVQIFNQNIAIENSVKVYSSYPFNGKKDIVIAAGTDKGVKKDNVITSGKNVLVGKVKEVLDSSSVVNTIFDPDWEIAVRIGEKQVDALFHGGNELKVGLIPSDADISVGQMVMTSGSGLPYGLEIGKIKEIKTFAGNPFKEAVVEPKIRLSELKDVEIRF